MSQALAFAPFRNDCSTARANRQIALLRYAIDRTDGTITTADADMVDEAQALLRGMILMLQCDEHFTYRLHNAAAGAR